MVPVSPAHFLWLHHLEAMEALCNATSQTPWVVTRPAEGSMFQKKCLHVSLVFLHPSPKSQAPERNKRTVVISGVQFCSILNRQGTVASITLQFRHARPQRGAQVGEMQNQQFTLYTQLATKPLRCFSHRPVPNTLLVDLHAGIRQCMMAAKICIEGGHGGMATNRNQAVRRVPL